MKFKKVKLKNFKSYPDSETELNLDFDGVKLLVGENGVGKTTFFDAIIWCIYGKSMANADDVVSWITLKDCKVEVIFESGGSEYSIIRYRKHEKNGNKLLFFKNNTNIGSRVKGDTQAQIEGVVEISYHAMISSVILSSELYSSFLRSKPSERLKSFESILSLKDVNEYNKALKKSREPLTEEIKKIEDDLLKNSSSLETLTSTIEGYGAKIKKTLTLLKVERQEKQEKVLLLEKRVNEFREIDVDTQLKKNEDFDLTEKNNEALKETIKKEKLRLKDVEICVKDYNTYRNNITELRKINVADEISLIDKYDTIKNKNIEIKEGISKLEGKRIDTTFKISRSNQLEKNIKSLEKEIKDMKDSENKCPTCSQKIDQELSDKLISEKEKDLIKVEEEFEEIKNSLIKDTALNIKLSDGVIKLTKIIKELPETSDHTREELAKVSDQITNNESLLKESGDLCKASEDYNKEINERVKELNLQLVEDNDPPEHHTLFLETLKKKIEEVETEAEELRSEIIVIDTKAKSSYDKEYVDETKKKMSSLKTKVTKGTKKLEVKKVDDLYYNVLAQVFSNKEVGFKKFFINKMIKIFNDRINFYIPFFFDTDLKIEFDKDLNEIIHRNGKEVNFGSFSSGQKMRFELAISFAMFMMVKTFFSSTVNILVFDEILDTNLDKKGFNSVVEILENLGDNNGVFVVSHQDFYRSRFKSHIEVVLDSDGFSKILKQV